MKKVCKSCGKDKDISEFYQRPDNLRYIAVCRPCQTERNRRWSKEHPGRKAEQRKAWRLKNKEKIRGDARIASLKKYGITLEQYNELLVKQGGVCAVCKKAERGTRNTTLTVDHDHVTGRVRGLLCTHCNRAIGLLDDDPDTLGAARSYILAMRETCFSLAGKSL